MGLFIKLTFFLKLNPNKLGNVKYPYYLCINPGFYTIANTSFTTTKKSKNYLNLN